VPDDTAVRAAELRRGVALVTGAARRIGRAIATRLAAEGFAVVVHASPASTADAAETAASIRAAGGRAEVAVADLADAAALGGLVAQAAAHAGPLTLLVNNASIFEVDEAASFKVADWDRLMAVNLRAPLVLARDFAAQVPADAEGAVVNITDQRVLRPTPQFFTYALTKSALWDATRTMAQAFAPRGIRVNAVGPGPVLPNAALAPEGFAREVAGLPLRRAVSPEEIAEAVVFLATARNVTGQMIAVDAGQHLAWQTPDIVG
jgi:NAD(P)-dependent dehydrogenase (short-subunit alcohol dehydrogenase family)